MVKRDIHETNIMFEPEKDLVNIKEFYNEKFIAGKMKVFIRKFNSYGDINPNSTPIRVVKANLLQKMQLNSPIKQTLQSAGGSNQVKPRFGSFHEDRLTSEPIVPKTMTPFSRLLYATDSPSPSGTEIMLKKYFLVY